MRAALAQGTETVLDLGIGQGGAYLLAHPAQRTVGLDRDRDDLRCCAQHYGRRVPLQLLQADGAWALPFRTGSFGAVQIFFPYRLLLALTDPERPLWAELARVTTPVGRVVIIFDVYRGKKRIRGEDEPVFLYAPGKKLAVAAVAAGFVVAQTELSATVVHEQLGTEFSEKIARWAQDPEWAGRQVFQVVATKAAPPAL